MSVNVGQSKKALRIIYLHGQTGGENREEYVPLFWNQSNLLLVPKNHPFHCRGCFNFYAEYSGFKKGDCWEAWGTNLVP